MAWKHAQPEADLRHKHIDTHYVGIDSHVQKSLSLRNPCRPEVPPALNKQQQQQQEGHISFVDGEQGKP